jgi:hypothetical protein
MSGSYYTLNSKYNQLLALIQKYIASPGTQDLASVLALGNSAGAFDIDLNNNDINNVANINGSPYPPVVAADNLQAVLTAGNTADLGFDLTLPGVSTSSSVIADLQATFSSVDVGFVDITGGGITSSSIIKSQLNQTDYSTSVVDNTTGLSATKTLITTGGAVLNTDTATNGVTSQVGLSNSSITPTNVASGHQYSQLGTTSSITTTNNATIAGQTHLHQVAASGETGIQLTAASGGNAGIACSYQSDPFDTITQGEFSINTGGATCSVQASSVASGVSQLLRMEAPLSGDAVLEHLVPGAGAQNLKIQSSNNILLTSDNLTSTATNFRVLSTAAGGGAVPLLTLTNTNAAAGAVAMEVYRNKPTAGVNGEALFQQSCFGKDSANNKQEYTRITHTIRDITSGSEEGSIEMGCVIGGTYANMIQLNGVDTPNGEVNILRPIDLSTGSTGLIKISGSGSVDLSLDATNSAGTGHIHQYSKTGTAFGLTADINLNATASTGNGDVNLLTKRGVVVNLNDEVNINTTASTTTGDIDITTKSGGITTISSTLINLNSIGGGAVNLNSTGNIGLTMAAGGFLLITNLPTSNPGVAGAVWNNGGVLNIV